MQILRINKIKSYRIYQNWHQPNNTDFARFNVIYGGNGSGKSTLAYLLSDLAAGKWDSGTILTAKDDTNQHSWKIEHADSRLTSCLSVFNADYVNKNLRFENGEANSLLYLGKESIDNQERREVLEQAILTADESTIPTLQKQLQDYEKKRKDIGTTGATKVSKKLQNVDDRYNGRRYNRKSFLETLDKYLQDSKKSNSLDKSMEKASPNRPDFDIDEQIKRVESPAKTKLTALSGLSIPLIEVTDQVSRILAQTVTSEAIEALKNNHKAAVWVQTGMQLHQAGDRCLFCEGSYTEERVGRLNRHFDKSMKRVQQEIDTLDTQISEYERRCEQFATSLEPPRALDDARTKCWVDQAKTLRSDITLVKEYLAFLRKELARKRKELFQPLELDETRKEGMPPNYAYAASLNVIIHEHNSDIDNYDNLKKQVCSKVIHYYIEEVRSDYTEAINGIQEIKDSLNEAKQERDNKVTELQRLQNIQQDRVHFAELLTSDLHRYFGRDELTFELSGEAYSIRRNGKKAENLSEGEQRSIALLYFLRDIESNDAKLRQRIIVFDDPVSSVDDGAATGAFAYIWDKCIGTKDKGVGQLFILTHNFDFFRRWVNRLTSLKRISEDPKNLVNYSVRELRVNSTSSSLKVSTRNPFFVHWDKPWKYSLLRSEYNYLFWRAATELERWNACSSDALDEYDAAILPNVCRRLLEGFLSFRCPKKIGNFEGQMKDMLDNLEDSAKRNYLVRFLHEYSHNEQCDPNKHIQLLETPKIIESIFSVIQEIDEPHYTAMCDALKVSPIPSVTDNAACK